MTTRRTVRRLRDGFDPAGRGRGVALIVLLLALGLVLGASVPAEAQFGKNKIRYKDFEWKIYHSPHFDVYYYEEAAGQLQKVVSFAESAYDQLSQELDFKIEEPTPLIFYLTHADFEQNNIILNFIPEGLGAFASPIRNRMVLPIDLSDPELMALILHELTHIFQYHMIFGGNLGKGVTSRPPLWFMEGMASFFAEDETARDRMFLRDAVVNDTLPSVVSDFSGFFAYRFGHAFFEFVEERWGKEAVRDFIIETRNTLGGRVGRAIERTFNMPPEDFNAEFRRWLRQRYLPELVETGEPGDFGRRYRLKERSGQGYTTSPTAAPSGDLLAAFVAHAGGVDIMLYDNRSRRMLSNLTKGYDTEFQYLVVQELTLGRKDGRDLAFSPDGNQLAFFARKNEGRQLVLLDVLKEKIVRQIPMSVGQQSSPAWSPDGSRIAFSAHDAGQFDIYEYELETDVLTHVTNDSIYDAAPVYSPDGKSIVLASVAGGYSKLYRVDLADPEARRISLTGGQTNETDPVFGPDGRRIYFTSDRTGANNIYSLDLETEEIRQHTNSVTGCFQPTVLSSPDGSQRLVYTAFWKNSFDLYQVDLNDPITQPEIISADAEMPGEALSPEDVARYEPAIEVAIDDQNVEGYGGFNFFIEDIGGAVGVSDDQTFIASTVVRFSDFLGDRRIIASFASIESFQNFNVIYADLRNRLQWQLHLYDDRDFFILQDQAGFFRRGRRAISQTGLTGSMVYPFNVGHRGSLGLGYNYRELDFVRNEGIPLENFSGDGLRQLILDFGLPFDPNLPDEELRAVFFSAFGDIIPIPVIEPRTDDYPQVFGSLTGDSAIYSSWGPVTGRLWNLSANYAPDTNESGTLTAELGLEFRQYIPITRRMQLAYRLYGRFTDGNFATPIYFGGLDTVRGYEFRSLVGDQAFFQNIELRFPLIDFLATPIFSFQGVRGRFFLDVGGAWFDNFESFRFYNSDLSSLQDAVASYGFGITARLFGLDVHWDFAKRYDLDRTLSDGFDTSFWIGQRF